MIDKIYVVHLESLVDRKKYLDSILPNFNIPFEYYISNGETDKEILNNVDSYYKFDVSVLNRRLSDGEICVAATHIKIYNDILKNNYNYCLIIEDDAIFSENFYEKLIKIMEEKEDYDLIFLSSCCDLHKTKTSDKFLYNSEKSRCVSGYVLNRKKLERMIELFSPISTTIDENFNFIKNKMDIKYAWCEPTVINQGSENTYKSNLR